MTVDLVGKRILVVEDEPIVAMALEDILDALGCAVAGPAASLAAGLAMAGTLALDAALLDVNLAGEDSFPIARVLERRRIPHAFTTGYGHGLAGQGAAPVIAKPYRAKQIRDTLMGLLASGA